MLKLTLKVQPANQANLEQQAGMKWVFQKQSL